jgi:Putative porin
MRIYPRLTVRGTAGLARLPKLLFTALLAVVPVARAANPSGAAAPSTLKGKPAGSAGTRKSGAAPGHSARSGSGTAARSVSRRAAQKVPAAKPDAAAQEVALLKEQLAGQQELLAAQQQQISKLMVSMAEQKQLLEHSLQSSQSSSAPPEGARPAALQPPSLGQVASLQPMIPSGSAADAVLSSAAPAITAPATSQQVVQGGPPEGYQRRVDQLNKAVENLSLGVAGFRFSGDFRVRSDNIWRSADADGGAEQNIRGRYRARFNIDRTVGSQVSAHLQLGSGNFDNPLTDDTDFGASATRGPIFLSEAWVNFHPNSTVNLQAGRMYDVFQDGTRFMWDEDVRFDGAQESVGASPADNPLGITRIDFRAGQYVLTNPNIQVLPSAKACTPAPPQTITTLPTTITTPPTLPAACAYLAAGYSPGENVRSADMFDQGFFIKGRIKPGWSQYFYTDYLAFRNQNQIALASTSAGLPVLVNNILGVTLAATLPGTGSATTTPGGGIYSASHFDIGHLAYRLTYDGGRLRGEAFPVFIDVQGSRNLGTSFLRNAWMATLNAGDIQRAGDVRFQYAYGEKDANSMISQYTDDQFGTNSGVNVRTHAFRFDVGLTRFLQWQNIFYIQNPISGNDPARHFYVPVPLGVNTQYRATSSLFVNF